MARTLLVVALSLVVHAAAAGQDPVQLGRLFEAGQYKQVVDATPPEAPPAAVYVAAQSLQKLGANDQALAAYGRLANLPDDNAWRFIGLSASHMLHGDLDGAHAAATRAFELAPEQYESRFQLGLVLARRQQWAEATQAFDTAAQLNPSSAYAHYYAGLMSYRAGRPDRMAIHFEQFLKLAPRAPERPEVLQIMKTVRGR
jgi:tetratricopeptide (TPR) repeat protein